MTDQVVLNRSAIDALAIEQDAAAEQARAAAATQAREAQPALAARKVKHQLQRWSSSAASRQKLEPCDAMLLGHFDKRANGEHDAEYVARLEARELRREQNALKIAAFFNIDVPDPEAEAKDLELALQCRASGLLGEDITELDARQRSLVVATELAAMGITGPEGKANTKTWMKVAHTRILAAARGQSIEDLTAEKFKAAKKAKRDQAVRCEIVSGGDYARRKPGTAP